MFEAVYFSLAWLGGEGIAAVILMLLIALVVLGQQGKVVSRQAAPALMTSLGIFGTFCGIFVALYEFDLANENGFQEFLNGMKTAFVTSLLGIAFAIVSRAFWSRPGSGEKSRHPEQREIVEHLEAIKEAIAGDGDSSMVTQMREMRKENREGFEKLDGLSEAIRDALVKNLQKLMRQLQTILGEQLKEQMENLVNEIKKVMVEQLGTTFTDLKDAVIALNEWQRQHREQLEQMTNAFNAAAAQIVVIAAKCEKIPETMEQLRSIIETANGDIEKLNRQLEAFANLGRQAEDALPNIQGYLNKVLGDLENSAKGFEGLEGVIRQTCENAVNKHKESVEAMVANLHGQLEKANAESSEKVTRFVENALENFSIEMKKAIDGVALEWGRNLVAVAEQAAESIEAAKKREGSR